VGASSTECADPIPWEKKTSVAYEREAIGFGEKSQIKEDK